MPHRLTWEISGAKHRYHGGKIANCAAIGSILVLVKGKVIAARVRRNHSYDLASSQAAQLRAADSLLTLTLSARLIGQP